MINVIIPCYNSSLTLPDTLNSLVAQTLKRFIVTVVDDCSSEDMLKIIDKYNEKLNINYIKLEENSGPGTARQRGIDENQFCEYLLFLDADDMLFPNAIEVLTRETNLHKPDILVSSFIQQNKYGIDNLILSDNNLTWVHGKVYKASYLKEKNIDFPEGIRVNEDGAFNTKAFGMTNNIYKISLPTCLWVDNKNSITRSNKDFEYTCLPSYIEGQTCACDFLLKNKKIEKIPSTLVCMYNYYQVIKYQKVEVEDRIEKALEAFLKKLKKQGYFDMASFKKELQKCLVAEKPTKTYLYFNTQTFAQWINSYGVELS